MNHYFVTTVDVDPPFSSWQNYVIEKGVDHFLKLFKKYSIKATFFIPGVVAKEFPKTIRKIVEQKHEIACHGLKHEPLEATLDISKQMLNIKEATEIIESITGLRPTGFRAPLFNVNKNCWISLYKNGYVYDSSVVSSPLYGNYKRFFLKSKPYFLADLLRDENCNLLEIPVSAFLFPLGGGWLRLLGLKWMKTGIKANLVFHTPIVFYVHPKDVVYYNPHGLPWYYSRNISKCLRMLDDIIKYVKQRDVKFITAYELARVIENYRT